MSFDLSNASVTFQAYINKALSELVNRICVVYLDDILIFSQMQKKHWRHVDEVLERLKQYSLYVKLFKCRFMIQSVEFLEYIISNHDISMNFSRVEAIRTWSTSKNLRELQMFLSFSNFYRRFVVKFVKISRSLTELLKESKNEKQIDDFMWNVDAEQTFR